MDLDLDFELDDDKIKTFLESKLSEIKAKNGQLEQTLQDRRQFSKERIESCNVRDESDIKINPQVWSILNDKYVIGITIVNTTCRQLCNISVLLDWDSTYPLFYHTKVYQKDDIPFKHSEPVPFCNEENCNTITSCLTESDKIDKLAYVVITFDVPKFTDKIAYNIRGNITFQQDDKEICLTFPNVEISSSDATNHKLNEFPASEDEMKDIITIISASVRTDLVMILPKGWSNSIDSTFEILCALRHIDVPSKCRKFFVATRLFSPFDGSLIELHAPNNVDLNVLSLVVYTRDQDCLYPLLHHLHRNIQGVVVIPKSLHENYVLQHCDSMDIDQEKYYLEKFNECVDKEIRHVESFLQPCQRIQSDNSAVIKFRTDLADLEKNTDLHYLRLCKMIFQTK